MNQRKKDEMIIGQSTEKSGSTDWMVSLQEPTCGRLVVQRWRPGYVDLKAAQGEADPDGSGWLVCLMAVILMDYQY